MFSPPKAPLHKPRKYKTYFPNRDFRAKTLRRFVNDPPPVEPEVKLDYVYIFRSTGYVDAIDVRNTTTPVILSTTELAFTLPVSSSLMVQDSEFIYVKNFYGSAENPNNTYIIDWKTNPGLPVLVKTMSNTGVVNFGPSCGDLIVRKLNTTYDNLLFGWGATNNITSHDISDPLNPLLVDSVALSPAGEGLPSTLAFNASSGRLYFAFDRIGGGQTRIGYVVVSSTGFFSGMTTATIHISVNFILQGGVIFDNQYWLQIPPLADYLVGYSLSNLSATGGLIYPVQTGILKPLVWNNHIIIGRTSAFATSYPVGIFDNTNPYPVLVGHIGSLNGTILSMMISGNTLFTVSGTVLSIHDITIPSTPALISTMSVTSGSVLSMSGYPSGGWDGQNGLCSV